MLGPLLELVLTTSTPFVSGILPLEAGTTALWMVFERDPEEGKFMAESHVPTYCPLAFETRLAEIWTSTCQNQNRHQPPRALLFL